MSRFAQQVQRLAAELRRCGARVGPGELAEALASVEQVDIGQRQQVKAALRCTLARHPDAWHAFDELFDRLFPPAQPQEEAREPSRPCPSPGGQAGARPVSWSPGEGEGGEAGLRQVPVPGYSPFPRTSGPGWDPAGAGPSEPYEEVARQVAQRLQRRPSRRYRPARRGKVPDLRRIMREEVRWGGEPLRWRWRQRKLAPGRLVLLCDVSGSMQPFGRVLMRFAYTLHRILPRRVEVFAFSTTLVRISAHLRGRDPDLALRRAAAALADWGGGTRIGFCLSEWCRRYGPSPGGSRTTVVVLSDGLDLGERELLERASRQVRRYCRKLVWLNPLLSDPRYYVLARRWLSCPPPGVDAVVPAHDPRTLALLALHLP